MAEPHLIQELLREWGPGAFPTIAAVALWYKLIRLEERLSEIVDKYVDICKQNAAHIADNTSALRALRCNARGWSDHESR